MNAEFEAKKNQQALMYTLLIMGAMAILFLLIKFAKPEPPPPLVEDMIEINLGNLEEGFGEVQPLVSGDPAPDESRSPQASLPQETQPSGPDPNEDENDEEAPVVAKNPKPINNKPVQPVTKPNTQPVATNPAPTPAPKPAPKPKITMPGGTGTGGNGAREDNGYTMQGNNPNGRGDAGSPGGNPDSYGTKPGGRTGSGGPIVRRGDRKIIKYYSFSGDYEKATIYANIKVNPEGRGTFVSFAKGSTKTGATYSNAIRQYLQTMSFDKADHESNVVVQFNFNVN